jgi:NTE family protein
MDVEMGMELMLTQMRIIRNRIQWGVCILLLTGCAAVPTGGPASAPVGGDGSSLPPSAATPQPVVKRLPRVGLALGGGAARGFAHVGVIQVLEEAGIKPDLVVGTSAGSLVAALYASGRTGAQLLLTAESMEEAALTDWMLPFLNRGVIKGEALARFVSRQVDGKPIESMPMPLGIVATNLQTGQGVLFQRGDTGTAVRASSSVPAVFQPVRIGGQDYVDGGLVAPVPVRQARQMGAELVIAVDISSIPEGNLANDTLQILLQTFAIMGQSINQVELREADVVIRPALQGVKSADFAARQRSIEAGRQAMRLALPRLRERLTALSR